MTELEMYRACNDIRYQGKPCVKFLNYHPGTYEPMPPGYAYIKLWINAIAVEDGKPCIITSGGLWSLADIGRLNMASFVNHVRDSIVSLQLHEVNETLSYKGVRYFDPHSFGTYEVIKENHVCPLSELTSAPELDNAEDKLQADAA